jgi:hypothetical protein
MLSLWLYRTNICDYCVILTQLKSFGKIGITYPSLGMLITPLSYLLNALIVCLQPRSEVFSDGSKKITVGGYEIKTLGIFKKGIMPTFEDKANAEGYQLEANRSFNAEAIDVQWENLVLALIGETVDEEDQICGARLVNQTPKRGKGATHTYKIEVWLRRRDDEMAAKIKVKLGELLSDVDKAKPSLKLTADEFVIERRK